MNQSENTTALASLLETRLMDWERSRKPQELKMLECYQDVMRIARDDDTNGTGASKTKKAKSLFIGSSRNKVRSARAKINDALFGNGQMPFDTNPTDESLRKYADVMEDIITDQMERGGFKQMLRTGVNTLATYGTGFMFGPFVRKEKLKETTAEMIGGSSYLQEQEFEFDLPFFDLANTLDVYPDPEAREMQRGLGTFWVTMESKHTVKAWGEDDSYQNIDAACIAGGDNGNETGSEIASQLRANVEFWFKNDRIKVARFFGKVPRSMVPSEVSEVEEPGEPVEGMVDAVVIMAGGVVVKIDESPYDEIPAHTCVYEAVEHEMWGVGVAENNMPHQKVTNAAFRLFMEGKGMALLGTSSVDRSKFMPTENFVKYPGKVYQFKPGLSPEERNSAIIHHVEPDITNGWIDVIRMSEQFSDDDTAITKYTQGDDSRNLNKTATGISMIMSAASLPTKEVIQNIDQMWIEKIVECYVNWNLKFLEPETVLKIHGQEAAELWRQIKEFGKSSFMNWKATGTSSFMQKEVLTNKIRAFAEFALSNPITAQKVDATELLTQTWDVMEIGRESPILKDEGEKVPEQVKQQMGELQKQVQALSQALEAASKHAEDLEESQEIKMKELFIKAYGEETKRWEASMVGVTPEQVQAIAMQTMRDMMTQPPLEQQITQELPDEPPEEPMPPPEQPMQQEQPEAPQGAFLTPGEGPQEPGPMNA
jgi:hypothetical protein